MKTMLIYPNLVVTLISIVGAFAGGTDVFKETQKRTINTTDNGYIESVQTTHSLKCGRRCSSLDVCMSASFNRATNECRLSSRWYEDPGTQLDEDSHTDFMQKLMPLTTTPAMTTTTTTTPDCPTDYSIEIINAPSGFSWSQADAMCAASGGQLVHILDEVTYNCILPLLTDGEEYWIDGRKPSNLGTKYSTKNNQPILDTHWVEKNIKLWAVMMTTSGFSSTFSTGKYMHAICQIY